MGCDVNRFVASDDFKRISIHAPIVGCDQSSLELFLNPKIFQSTHPSWGATLTRESFRNPLNISIHAPIVGCDDHFYVYRIHAGYFNPRTHRGVRPYTSDDHYHYKIFQSTHPSWVRPQRFCNLTPDSSISIHAPIVGVRLR